MCTKTFSSFIVFKKHVRLNHPIESHYESCTKSSPIKSDDLEWSDSNESDSDEESEEIFDDEEIQILENLSQEKLDAVNNAKCNNVVSELDHSKENILQFIAKLYSYGDVNRKRISTIINDELESRKNYLGRLSEKILQNQNINDKENKELLGILMTIYIYMSL